MDAVRAEAQFQVAVSELSKIDVRIKGDIPILINEGQRGRLVRPPLLLSMTARALSRYVQLQRTELGLPHVPLECPRR